MAYWPGIVIVIVVGFAMKRSEANPYADLSNSLSKTALEALQDTFDRIGKSLRLDTDDNAKIIGKDLFKLFREFHTIADNLLKTSMEMVKVHAQGTITVFGDDNYIRAWRIAGAVITATLLGVFLFADIIQAAFSLSDTTGFSGITKRFLTANPTLDNLPLSMMISSVGTVATLAFILVDMWGITKFIPWEDAPMQNDTSIIDRLKPWVIRLLFMTILVAPLFAVSRLQGVHW